MLRVLVMLLATAVPVLAAEGPVCIEDATIVDLQKALAAGTVTATDLTRAYIARIEAYDRAGPNLNAIRELNPDALKLAGDIDAARPPQRRPLEGIPILLKDNIATGDAEHTTAGSLALADAQAHRDAFLVKRLRDAGAVILGKTNLTEFANILAIDMPAGYSSLGGQVRNPYVPQLDEKGVPVVTPGGSSSGSAVAVAAGFAAAAIGTETSGSLLSPASQNGVVTVKPTVGLISRSGIIPIAHSQDTAGPLTRTVRDAALLLNVLAAPDPEDEATRDMRRPADYTAASTRTACVAPASAFRAIPPIPANDVIYGQAAAAPRRDDGGRDRGARGRRRCGSARQHLRPSAGWAARHRGGDPQPQSASPTRDQVERRPLIYLYELKHDLNAYLRDWAKGTKMQDDGRHHRLQRRQCRPRAALRPGHLPRRRHDAWRLERDGVLAARQMDILATRTLGLDAYMDANKLDAVLFPGRFGSNIAAKAGYPSVQVPGGMMRAAGAKPTPDYPFGVTFTGRAWSEPVLLRLAYAFEQATKARRPPPGMPALTMQCEAPRNARTAE